MKSILLLCGLVCSLFAQAQPKVSFTFDDGSGSTRDRGGYPLEEWNQMILDKLATAAVKSTLFSTGKTLSGTKGSYVLHSWNAADHQIVNHTYTHPNYNSDSISIADFKAEVIK